jgi:hypothetical protein
MPAPWHRSALDGNTPPHHVPAAPGLSGSAYLAFIRLWGESHPAQSGRRAASIMVPQNAATAGRSWSGGRLPSPSHKSYRGLTTTPGTPMHRGLSFACFWSREWRELIERATSRRTGHWQTAPGEARHFSLGGQTPADGASGVLMRSSAIGRPPSAALCLFAAALPGQNSRPLPVGVPGPAAGDDGRRRRKGTTADDGGWDQGRLPPSGFTTFSRFLSVGCPHPPG